MRHLIFLLVLFPFSLTCSLWADDTWNRRVEAVRQAYRPFTVATIPIKEPVVVSLHKYFYDGGTTVIDIIDVNDMRLRVALPVSPTGNLYRKFPRLRATGYYESNMLIECSEGGLRESVKLPIRCPEETAIYALLLRWESRLPEPLDDSEGLFHLCDVLEGLDIRFAYRDGDQITSRYNPNWVDSDKGLDRKKSE